MDWIELSVTVSGETAEAVVELLNRYCTGGAVVEVPVDCFEHELAQTSAREHIVVKGYLPAEPTLSEDIAGTQESSEKTLLRRVEEGLWHLSQIVHIPRPTIRRLAEEDWASAWKQQYHAIRIGRRIHIVPAWEEPQVQAEDAMIRLEPGMAFGTGLHPSTRLCLEALEERIVPGCTVLDVGTGSGILAIAAAVLGARSVLALDIDPVAVAVARENVACNGVGDRVLVRRGTLAGGTDAGWLPAYALADEPLALCDSGSYDLVVVNILAPVIAGMARALSARTAPEGQLIAAGLIAEQEGDVVRSLQQEGLRVTARAQQENWVALIARKGPPPAGEGR